MNGDNYSKTELEDYLMEYVKMKEGILLLEYEQKQITKQQLEESLLYLLTRKKHRLEEYSRYQIEQLKEYCKPYNIEVGLVEKDEEIAEDKVIGWLMFRKRYTGKCISTDELGKMEECEVRELVKEWAKGFKQSILWGFLEEFPKIKEGDTLSLLQNYDRMRCLEKEYNRWKEEGLLNED